MNPEDVIRMAREAGWPDSLVAPIIMAKLAEIIKVAQAAEREACAKLIEDKFDFCGDELIAAAAIRERSQQ